MACACQVVQGHVAGDERGSPVLVFEGQELVAELFEGRAHRQLLGHQRTLAAAESLALRMISITRSMESMAASKPKTMLKRALASLSSKTAPARHHLSAVVEEVGQKLFQRQRARLAVHDGQHVNAKGGLQGRVGMSWFRMTSAEASFFSSMTIRMPSRSDSSRMSPMPSRRFSRTISATRSTSAVLFT